MTEPIPFPTSPYCRVRARVASIWADGPDDGTHPDWMPAAGERVTLTPSIGSQLLTYDATGPNPIIVTVERVECVVDDDGWLTKADGRPVFIAPTDDPLLSATGWTWTASIKGKSVVFAAPSGGVVDLAVFIAAPATDDTKAWIERIPELITAGANAVDAAAAAEAARDTATGAASTATEQAGLAATARTGAEAAALALTRATPRLSTEEDSSLDALGDGIHIVYVRLGAHATALDLPVTDHGLLIVIRYGNAGGAWYWPRNLGSHVYKRPRNGGVWGTWISVPDFSQAQSDLLTSLSETHFRAELAMTETSLDDLGEGPQMRYVPFGSRAELLGLPTGATSHGWLSTWRYGNGGGALWFPRDADGIWRISRNAGAWGTWTDILAPDEAPPDMMARHQHIRQRHENTIAAPIDVGTATPVCFVWDDYPAALRDNGVIAAAQLHDVPINVALCSRTLDPAYASTLGGEGITWAEIDAWVAAGTVELSNHGATHRGSALTPDMLEDEIVTGLDELQANSPSSPPITTWVMPTIGPTGWGGFDSGSSPDRWAGLAGQLILGHHAFATGTDSVRPDRTRRMLGTPVQGDNRQWVESVGMTQAQRQALVTDLYGTDRGIIISAHASWIGESGRWSQADVEAFFAWLAGEQAAGRIELMHLSRWPWALTRVVGD